MRFVRYDDTFKKSLVRVAVSLKKEAKEILYGSTNPDGTRNPDGIIDHISRRFMIENADKPIILLAPFANPDSVYVLSEIPQIMNMEGACIEGLSRKFLQKGYHSGSEGQKHIKKMFSSLSLKQAIHLRCTFDKDGELAGVDLGKAWNGMFYKRGSNSVSGGDETISVVKFMEKLTPQQRVDLYEFVCVVKNIRDLKAQGKYGVHGSSAASSSYECE